MTGVIAGRETRELWLGGRGPVLLLGFSVLLSVIAYLTASSQVLNFLEQREAVGLVMQLSVAVGCLVTMLLCADAISGERERATLESLLLAPVSSRAILYGKLLAALTWWVAAFVVTVPYVWVLGRGVYVIGSALPVGLLVGTLVASGLACLGLIASGLARTNRVSLAASTLLLLALFAPTQLPSGLPQSWFGEALDRVNPIGAALHYIAGVVVHDRTWTTDLTYLIAPAVVLTAGFAVLRQGAGRLVQLNPGGRR